MSRPATISEVLISTAANVPIGGTFTSSIVQDADRFRYLILTARYNVAAIVAIEQSHDRFFENVDDQATLVLAADIPNTLERSVVAKYSRFTVTGVPMVVAVGEASMLGRFIP